MEPASRQTRAGWRGWRVRGLEGERDPRRGKVTWHRIQDLAPPFLITRKPTSCTDCHNPHLSNAEQYGGGGGGWPARRDPRGKEAVAYIDSRAGDRPPTAFVREVLAKGDAGLAKILGV